MNIIADTNIFLAVALNEPERQLIIELTAGVDAVSPEILPYEIGNALSAMTKRKQLTATEALYAEVAASKIPVRLVTVDIRSALNIAIEHNIYAYDAYFLQCAENLRSPLLTLDIGMQRVAREIGITILE